VAKKGRDVQREAFWRKTLRQHDTSGLTVLDFCEREGLKPTTFHLWRREIQRRDDELTTVKSRHAAATAPAFAPVEVVGDRPSGGVEIVARNGLVVRVGEEAATEHVRHILQLVHEMS
jgi:hypothetical protein